MTESRLDRGQLRARPALITGVLALIVPAAVAIVAALNGLLGGNGALATIEPKYLVAGAVMLVGAVCAVVAAGSLERGLFLLFVLSVPVRAVLRLGNIPRDVDVLLGEWTPSGNAAWIGYPLGQLSILLCDLPLALLWLLAIPGFLRRPHRSIWWIFLGAAVFVLAEIASVAAASQRALAWWAVVETAKAVAAAAYLVHRTRSRNDFRFCLNAVSLAVVLQSAVGMAQFLTGSTLGVTFSGLAWGDMLEGGSYLRASGTFPHPQMLAMYVCMFLPLFVAAGVLRERPAIRAGRVLALLAAAVALILTFSRMGWLAGGIGSVLVVFTTSLSRRYRRQVVRVGAALLLILLVTIPLWATIARNFTVERAGSELNIIADLYRVAFNMIRAHPLDGIGINNFSFVIQQYDTTGISSFYAAPVHNLFVLAFAEMGLLGGLGFATVMAVPAIGLWRARRRLDHEGRCLATGLLGGLLAFAVLSLTGWTYYSIQTPVWFFLGMALSAATGGLDIAERRTPATGITSEKRPSQRT